MANAVPKAIHICGSYDFGDSREGLFSLHHVPHSKNVCVGYGDGSIDVVSTDSMTVKHFLRNGRPSSLPIVCLRFSPQHHDVCFAASASGALFKYNMEDNSSAVLVEEPNNELTCFDFSKEGTYCASTGRQLTVRIYDTASFDVIREYIPSNNCSNALMHWNKIYALKFHPELTANFCTGGWDKTLKVWDLRTREGVVKSIYGPHLCGEGLDIRNNKIVTSSWVVSKALQLWDFGSTKLISNIPYLKPVEKKGGEFLYGVKFCTDDVVVTGGSGTNSARAINVTTSQILGEVKSNYPVQSIDVWDEGARMGIGGGGSVLHVASLLDSSNLSLGTSSEYYSK